MDSNINLSSQHHATSEETMIGAQPKILITNYGTHSPEAWASVLLDELVPTPCRASTDVLVKIAAAKAKLYPAVVEMVAAVRAAEQAGLISFTDDENAAAAATYLHYHGGTPVEMHWNTLHEHAKTKISPSTEWAEQHVNNICRIASEIDGVVGSNSRADETYRCLDRWISAIQLCERSHHVSSNNLHKGAI